MHAVRLTDNLKLCDVMRWQIRQKEYSTTRKLDGGGKAKGTVKSEGKPKNEMRIRVG